MTYFDSIETFLKIMHERATYFMPPIGNKKFKGMLI